jgi:hypothetical protein
VIGKQRALCRALVVEQGGLIVDDASDVGPGVIVDMPGYAHLYDALDRGTVDAFVTDMTVFGPTIRFPGSRGAAAALTSEEGIRATTISRKTCRSNAECAASDANWFLAISAAAPIATAR